MRDFGQTQHRLIMGLGTPDERHFVLVDESDPNIWAIPGSDVVAHEIQMGSGIRLFKHRTATTGQLEDFAKTKGLAVMIYPEYLLNRRAINS